MRLPDLSDIDAGLMRVSLHRFVLGAWHVLEPATPYQDNWHIKTLCDHIQAFLTDQPGPNGQKAPANILINVPPGSMKSLVFSVFGFAWMWLRRPSWRAIYASGTPSVVTRDSLKCRTLVKSEWYQKTFKPNWQISADQDEKQHFANTMGGFRKGIGAGATPTGERADFLGVDDPNSAGEAHSKAHQKAINEDWWSTAFHNRIADPTTSKRGIIMQRLNELDLAGYVLSREAGQWEHLCIPMEYEEAGPGNRPTWLGWSDPRKEEGDLLFPDRFTPAFLVAERQSLGSAGYAGQMQQRPAPAAGNKFKREWWRFWSPTGTMLPRPNGCSAVPPKRFNPAIDSFDECLQSWDFTFKGKVTSDFAVGLVVARVGADKYVLAMYRKQMGFTESKKAILQMTADWPEAYRKLIEAKANGDAIIDSLSGEISGIVPVEPKGGKEARAAAIEPQVEAGNVYLPEGAEWLDLFIDEFAAFPRGKHDDCVDALSQALIEWLDTDVMGARALLGMT